MRFLILLTLLMTSAQAAFKFSSFDYNSGKAVFVDFKEVTYEIKYDMTKEVASVKAHISFEQTEKGNPIFDNKEDISFLSIDGKEAAQELISTPSNETMVRVVNQELNPGLHEMVIESVISEGVEWNSPGVSSAFWTSDLDDRSYLEAYMPASFEYDQVKMIFDIEFAGATSDQKIFTNGKISRLHSNHWLVEFPEHFNCSSMFFHTVPAARMQAVNFTYTSIDGRVIPATVYNKDGLGLQGLKTKVLAVLAELEKDYGPFPHQSVTVYNSGWGGMEYHGATMTDAWALSHELTHSYFARGVMPANGNAGWIDEALASWRDNGYPNNDSVDNISTRMAAHPIHTRMTDDDAYSKGASFMAHLNTKFTAEGGLKPFLRNLVATQLFQPLTTEEFIGFLNDYYKTDLTPLFKKHIYNEDASKKKGSGYHPYHQKMSIKELKAYL